MSLEIKSLFVEVLMNTDEIMTEIKNAVVNERKMTARVLDLLKIVQDRKLYLDRGYSSLFDFAVGYLGYSEPAAARRISAMRLIRDLPQTREKIISGDLSLSNAAKVQNFFKNELKASRGLEKSEKIELLRSIENLSSRDCEKTLLKISPESIPKERRRELTESKTELKLILDEALIKQLDRLKSLWSHKNSNMTDSELLKEMAQFCLEKVDPLIKETKPTTTPELNTKSEKRAIPHSIKIQVWKKDHGKCRYFDSVTKRYCHSTHLIQIDHIKPWSKGGQSNLENLQLLCAAHNLHKGAMYADGSID